MRCRHLATVAIVVTSVLGAVLTSGAVPAADAAAPSSILGQGSTYVGLAMKEWTAAATTRGLNVTYQPSGSPQGLGAFKGSTVDFAGTEAEFSSLSQGSDGSVSRGFQYVPDVAGAVAVMYNVDDRAGNHVDYLRLSRSTVAKIFMGYISRWSDPQITADLGGRIVLPDQPIEVVYRGGQSGTTALFYDFVQNMEPQLFQQWAQRNRFSTTARIIELQTSPGFAPKTIAKNGSDEMASYVSKNKWSITYDEFGYALSYDVEAAWIQNESGTWVLPYAGNIAAALESAQLRPDLSQELSQVYRSRAPGAYPISAYSYLVTMCAPSGARPTCRGPYPNAGVAETLTRWMTYIACDGQRNMASIGYSPLPPNLSQEMMNSVARMNGDPNPVRLTRANCSNPQFDPAYRPPAPPPPPPLPAATTVQAVTDGISDAGPGTEGAADPDTPGEVVADGGEAAGRRGEVQAAGGGSGDWREGAPVAYLGAPAPEPGRWPLFAAVAVLGAPLAAAALWRRRRRAIADP